MLKQVSKEEAFKRYQEGQDVKILRPSSNTGRLVLFTFDELFQDSICLIDDKSDLKHVNTKSTEETCSTSTRGRKQKVDVDKIHALKNAGWNVKDIADEIGCTVSCVYYNLKH